MLSKLLAKAQYAPAQLLQLASQKFGVKVDEGTLWSELLRRAKRLEEIRPLLAGEEREQKETLSAIREYLERHGAEYLKRQWE